MKSALSHVDDIVTHLESEAIYDLLRFLVDVAVVYGLIYLQRAGIVSTKLKSIGLVVAALFLLISIGFAYHSHGRNGFFNGALFIINCFVSVLLVLVIIYPIVKEFLLIGIKKLDWVEHYPKGATYEWKTYYGSEEGSQGNSAAISPSSPSRSLSFGTRSADGKERWANMEIEFTEPQDFHRWSGISFDLKCGPVYPDTHIRLQISTSSDSRYLTAKSIPLYNQKASFSFQEMFWADWSARPPQGHLDLRQVQRIAVVCRTICDNVEFSVSNFALVKTVDS